MVLEGATSSADEYATGNESVPASDNDPWSEASSSKLDWDKLPRPLLPFRYLLPYSDSRMEAIVTRTQGAVRELADRSLTPVESTRIAHIVATNQTQNINLTGAVVGLSLFQCYRRRAEFRFPFMSPIDRIPRFNPDKLGPLVGGRARVAWHILRGATYYGLAWALTPKMPPSLSIMTSIASEPELGDLRKRIYERSEAMRQQGGNPPNMGGQVRRPLPRAQQQRTGQGGDMSSVASSEAFASGNAGSRTSSEDQSPSAQTYNPADDAAVSPSAPAWSEDVDDASPTAPPSSNPGRPGESPWDRIRRERGPRG